MRFQHQIQTSLILTFLSLVVVSTSGCFTDDLLFLEPGEYLFAASLSESGEVPQLPADLILTISEDKQSYSFAAGGESLGIGELEVLPRNRWAQGWPTNFSGTQMESFRLSGSFSLGELDYTAPGLSAGWGSAVLSPWSSEDFLQRNAYLGEGPSCLNFCLPDAFDECVDSAAGDDDDSAGDDDDSAAATD